MIYIHTYIYVCVCVCVCVCVPELSKGFPGGSDGKESACNAGDLGSIKKVEKILWRREWLPNPVLEISMDRGAQWATVHGIAKS